MIDKREYFLLNAFHVVVDGLRDSIPIVLAFIVVAFGPVAYSLRAVFSLLFILPCQFFTPPKIESVPACMLEPLPISPS